MFSDILKMTCMTLFPVLVSSIMYLLDKRTSFGKVEYRWKQLVLGLVFGGLAVMGTEFGINIDGAVLNVRDAAPLCAGLFFGAPAGIIAGLIGGIERWFSVLWGAGSYTRLACTLGTIFAGLLGAFLRKYLFDDKKPVWFYSLTTGLIAETLHLLLVFVTNMDDVSRAFSVVRQCAIPMLICNSIAVMMASVVISLLGSKELSKGEQSGRKQISQTIQRWLLVCVLIAFCVTNGFIFILQSNLTENDTEGILSLSVSDVQADIQDASDANMLNLTEKITLKLEKTEIIDKETLDLLKTEYDVSEISIVDENGFITVSTVPEYVGFDMTEGAQSKEFMILTRGEYQYVQQYQGISRDSSVSMKYSGQALENGGFVQVGYNAERFQQDIDHHVVGITKNRHVGEKGYIVLLDEQGNVVSDIGTHDGKQLSIGNLESIKTETVFEATVHDEECSCYCTLSEGYYIIAVLPVYEALFGRDIAVYVTAFMELLIFAALFIMIYFLIKRLVVDNIHRINGTLSQITGGNLNAAVDVRSNEEFASLSDDINSTVETLKQYIAEAAARIDAELEFARVIQESTLPSDFPPFPDREEFDIYAHMTPAKEVGGDFYDYYILSGNRLAFLIADVSGKGISAAMFMMTSKTLIKSLAEKENDVATVFTLANSELCKHNEAGMFVTCWMGVINLDTNHVTFANAGHNPPLVRHKNGCFEFFQTRPGFVLAGLDDMVYKSGEMDLLPGDEIFLYTDGVTEATDSSEELYGNDRLIEILNSLPEVSAKDLCDVVKADVDTFVAEAPQFDDITMLSLKINDQ